MKVAIYGQVFTDALETYLEKLLDALALINADVYIEEDYMKAIVASHHFETSYKTFASYTDLDSSFDMFFSVGGDGTILRAITYIRDHNIPIIGINTGRLGFLATVQKDEIAHAVKELAEGKFSVEERTLLEIKTQPEISGLISINFALNEIAVSRKNTTSMITVATYLNGEYLTSYWADGLIVATPTGSTGYSLSCGGPVIAPRTNSLVLTPIAPHNLNNRPLVISDNTEIKLQVSGREEQHLISLDSRIATANNSTEICIKKASFTVKMVELTSESFLKTLRKKLLWGEDKRN
jgi:NAD+ kinase